MSEVNKYMSNLSKVHYEAIKWISIYLKNIVNYEILFDYLLDNVTFLSYVDENYIQDVDKLDSQLGICLHLTVEALLKCVTQSKTGA